MEIPTVTFTVNGVEIEVPAEGTLLTALRERLPDGIEPIVSVKDGCAPQGQCGCCTVWVDGEPRVSCVTPVARVAGRMVTTLEGIDESVRTLWSQALCATGGSQCGFCTPGIIMRLEDVRRGLDTHGLGTHDLADHDSGVHDSGSPETESSIRETVNKALLAHMCRCTGWQTIHEAVEIVTSREGTTPETMSRDIATRDFAAASRRADMEGRSHQTVHPRMALGDGGFTDDIAPKDALVAVMSSTGEWVLGPDVASARRAAGSVQGRKSTVPVSWPIDIDPLRRQSGEFVRTLMTTWVEPAYLEPDAVWCTPGGQPVGPLVNGGAFGGKSDPLFIDELRSTVRRLADEQGRPVRVVLSREDVVRRTPKRPPMALGVRADGSGTAWVVRTPGVRDMLSRVAPDWQVIEVDAPGLPTSMTLRAAGWAEIAVARCSVREPVAMSGGSRGEHVVAPNGAEAWARVEMIEDQDDAGRREPVMSRERIVVRVRCGDPLDRMVLRSYCIGAAHMALGWVRSEGIAVNVNSDGGAVPVDLTIRSFGVLRAMDTPEIDVEIDEDTGSPVNGSDAVFAAVAAAVWRHDGFPPAWPTRR